MTEDLPPMDSTSLCDNKKCSAQARVRVEGVSGHSLEFCAHHFNDHEGMLMVQNFKVVIDNRSQLLKS
jgi:hypothetical protein